MKIAVYTNNFPNISQTFVINQISGLIDLGADVDVITSTVLRDSMMHDTVEKYNLMDSVICKKVSDTPKLKRLLLTAKNATKLILQGKFRTVLSVIRDPLITNDQKVDLLYWSSLNLPKRQYDNIICHFGTNGYYVCKMREVGIIGGPISTIFHGYELSRYRTLKENQPHYKKLFELGDLMLPISHLWKDKLIEMGCKPEKIRVHRMGIDVNDFTLRDVDSELSTPLKVIQVGRLTDKKAILDSINAVLLASKKIPIEFTIIGDGELYNEAKDLIEKSNANSFIHLLGKQPQKVVKDKLDEADIFLLPSVKAKDGDMEGVPVALMEAMAKGLITLSTYHSGIPELIENDVSGYLVNEASINELSDTLIKISQLSPEKVESIRRNAREKCESEFNNITLNKNIFNYSNLVLV